MHDLLGDSQYERPPLRVREHPETGIVPSATACNAMQHRPAVVWARGEPARMWAGVSPAPAQMWAGVSAVPVQLWQA